MAMSFARPDPSSPASVADAGFSTSRRGFDQAEVREFLRMIAAELGRLQERERFLERELRTAQSNPDFTTAQFDDAALTRLLGEETARVLTTARESAAEIRQKAEQAAAQLLGEASDEAARLREEAEIEASRRRSDAASDAEAELAMAKQQGREMVNEARAYRERVLSELARRRELAREQIEQLMHGRDRLMQSFERARLVAVDVVAELQPLGEPDEYVNLAPTTGPVPVMVPNSVRPDAEAPAAPAADTPDADAEIPDADTPDAEIPDADADAADVEPADADQAGPVEADAAAEQIVVEQIEARDDVDVVEDGELAEVAADGDDEVDERGDDVVVDLFARLRAESDTDTGIDTEDDTAADGTADDVTVDLDAVDGEPETAEVDAEVGDALVEPTPFEQRDADLTPIIVTAARKLKRVLADEQNEVLETLRRKEPVREVAALVPDADAHVARYVDAIEGDLGEAANAAAAMVGRTRKLRKADADAAIDAASDVLAEWLVAPLRERLERCVADGDGDNVDIGKRVRAVYREWKTQHIDEQLDDVVRTAHGRGVLAAVEPATPMVWVCDPSHRSCSDCDDNTLAGAVAAGDSFPTGHTSAPAHVGCRCLLLPERR
jgi:DivIVA domain-containing protein